MGTFVRESLVQSREIGHLMNFPGQQCGTNIRICCWLTGLRN